MREILIKGQLNKFKHFKEFAEEFNLGKRDLLFTNEFVYNPFIKDLYSRKNSGQENRQRK